MDKMLSLWAKSITIGLITLLFIPLAFSLFSAVANNLPISSGTSSETAQSDVYNKLDRSLSPDVSISENEISIINAPVPSGFDKISPFNELGSILLSQERNILFWSFLLIFWIILAVFFAYSIYKPIKVGYKAQVLVIMGLASASLPVLIYSLRPTWDEVFAFVSQAENFAKFGIWGIQTTGPSEFSESSADWFMTITAGLLIKIFGFISGETAVFASIFLLLLIYAITTSLILTKYLGVPHLYSAVLVGAIFFCLPQTILTTAALLPTALAVAGFVLFVLGVYSTLHTGKLLPFVISSTFALLSRWEYGIYVSIAALLIGLTLSIRVRRFLWQKWLILCAPIMFFALITLIRFSFFGNLVPSGVMYKNQGIDGAYISSGFKHLVQTVSTNYWPFFIGFGVFLVFSLSKARTSKQNIGLTLFFVLLPLGNSVVAGGDWFDLSYARYTLPTYVGIVVFTIVIIAISAMNNANKTFLSTTVISLLILSQLPSAEKLVSNINHLPTQGRVNCLAEGGAILGQYLPENVGLATAEINTVSYFSNQPLTDLSGLVDSRVASENLTPLNPGDPHHRKTYSTIIREDEPGAIYLYEGSNCSKNTASEAEEWTGLINSDVTRFRADAPSELLERYAPYTFVTQEGNFHRYLVKRDIKIE